MPSKNTEAALMRKKYSREFRLEQQLKEKERIIQEQDQNNARFAALVWEAFKELGCSDQWIYDRFDRVARWKK